MKFAFFFLSLFEIVEQPYADKRAYSNIAFANLSKIHVKKRLALYDMSNKLFNKESNVNINPCAMSNFKLNNPNGINKDACQDHSLTRTLPQCL
jgi:hypothetical protein